MVMPSEDCLEISLHFERISHKTVDKQFHQWLQQSVSFSRTENKLITRSPSTSNSEEKSLDFDPNGYCPVTNGFCLENQYKFLTLIGSGGFGTVHKLKDLETRKTVAMKIFRSGEMACRKGDRNPGIGLGHQKVVQFVKHFLLSSLNGEHLVMVFELLGPDLYSILKCAKKPLSLNTIRKFSKDILKGLDYIHTKCGVVHCDLKPHDLLISRTGALKLGDFGLSILNSEGCTDSGGTCRYMAPDLKQIAEATGETIYRQFYERTSRNERNFKAVFGRHSHFESSGPELLQVCRPIMENEFDVILDF